MGRPGLSPAERGRARGPWEGLSVLDSFCPPWGLASSSPGPTSVRARPRLGPRPPSDAPGRLPGGAPARPGRAAAPPASSPGRLRGESGARGGGASRRGAPLPRDPGADQRRGQRARAHLPSLSPVAWALAVGRDSAEPGAGGARSAPGIRPESGGGGGALCLPRTSSPSFHPPCSRRWLPRPRARPRAPLPPRCPAGSAEGAASGRQGGCWRGGLWPAAPGAGRCPGCGRRCCRCCCCRCCAPPGGR